MSVDRTFFCRPVLEVAPDLLGAVLTSSLPDGRVSVRLTEVEAYDGRNDPASHAYGGPTARNAVMFGPAGHVYVYFSYGMHWCMNVVCGAEGVAAAVLLRAGEVVDGVDLARRRRGARVPVRDLARGPARLTQALGVSGACNGSVLGSGSLQLALPTAARTGAVVSQGPRVGLSHGTTVPWRFWLTGDRYVSAYRAGAQARRRRMRCADAAGLHPHT
ncbi:MAG: DNA-3-methyladenine glycosylase [Actinomycetota bacterium]|nr:DNA-3-methyladenine glycosylase [Actinomycetota bacterium]